MTADDIIAQLDLQPHPEGSFYRQTWQADNAGRALGTSIYYLLKAGQSSHWHKVDAVEIWHFYAGAPLIVSLAPGLQGPATDHRLGPDLQAGATPQIIVPKDHWQMAVTTGNWTLAGCTVCPGFQFAGFALAAAGVDIPRQ